MTDPLFDSPEEEIHFDLFNVKNVSVFIKRDDMIHPFISGNKWRKLKYNLIEAQFIEKKHLVTFGGPYSNHLLATACAAAKFGFKSTGIVRGEPVENQTLMICKLFGMKLQFVKRTDYRDKQLIFNSRFADDADAYFINEGGSGNDAIKGCSELISELKQTYDHIVCACGTGTTVAGLLQGVQLAQTYTMVHAISVLKNAAEIEIGLEKFTKNLCQVRLHSEYNFGGYAKTNFQLLSFIKDFAVSTGILLDPVYTGKMMFGLFDLIEKDYFLQGSKILAIHTGGLMGLLGMSKEFNAMDN